MLTFQGIQTQTILSLHNSGVGPTAQLCTLFHVVIPGETGWSVKMRCTMLDATYNPDTAPNAAATRGMRKAGVNPSIEARRTSCWRAGGSEAMMVTLCFKAATKSEDSPGIFRSSLPRRLLYMVPAMLEGDQ